MSSSQPADPTGDGRAAWSRLLPRSLSGRLVLTTLVLVGLVSVLVGIVTTLTVRQFLLARLDDQVVTAALRQRTGGPPGGPGFGTTPCAVVPDVPSATIIIGQPPGTLLGRFGPTCRSAVVVTDSGRLHSLGRADLAALADLESDNSPQTVHLSIGDYRVVVADGLSADTVTGLPTSQVTDTVRRLALWEAAVALLAALVAGALGQWVVRRQLAPLRRVAATATAVTALPLDSGEVATMTRVPSDLTDPASEVGQVGSALNAMLGHVERALETRHESEQRVRRFVADASHELRTPLSTVMGYAELSGRTVDMSAMSHAMMRIRAESSRMSELVDDLLLLARLDSGRPLEAADVDVSRLLLEAVDDARVVGKDHSWRLSLPAQPLHVVGDRDRLHQVMANLLSNATRHTPAGTTVDVTASQASRTSAVPAGLVVTIHDDGPGFPPDLVGKEFERFSRGDSSRTRTSGGSGLGLSIVAAIVAAHHGTVDIRSAPGDTTIDIRLPQ